MDGGPAVLADDAEHAATRPMSPVIPADRMRFGRMFAILHAARPIDRRT
jgi:hypothetical protein